MTKIVPIPDPLRSIITELSQRITAAQLQLQSDQKRLDELIEFLKSCGAVDIDVLRGVMVTDANARSTDLDKQVPG